MPPCAASVAMARADAAAAAGHIEHAPLQAEIDHGSFSRVFKE
jgi:hypothetical protein